MADKYGRLAALRPADTNEAELYLVPSDTQIVATLTICNQGGDARTYSVAHTDATGAATGEDWLYVDNAIAANTTETVKGLTLNAAESIRVKASVADLVSFVLAGLKIT